MPRKCVLLGNLQVQRDSGRRAWFSSVLHFRLRYQKGYAGACIKVQTAAGCTGGFNAPQHPSRYCLGCEAFACEGGCAAARQAKGRRGRELHSDPFPAPPRPSAPRQRPVRASIQPTVHSFQVAFYALRRRTSLGSGLSKSLEY
eukprot:184324-Chlamydomonas_euryale.AAC.6